MKKLLVQRLVSALGMTVVLSLALSVGVPLGQRWPDGPGLAPLKALANLLSGGVAWATADPPNVEQQRGGAVDGAHESTAEATRANGGGGSAKAKGTGLGLAAADETKRPNSPELKTRARTGFVPTKSVMVAESSSPTQTLYRNPDGTYTNRVYQTPVNFKGTDGKFRPIDPTLVPSSDGRLRVAAHAVAVSFAGAKTTSWGGGAVASLDPESNPDAEVTARTGAATELASMTFPTGQSFGYQLQGARIGKATVSGNKVTYQDVLPFTDAELVATHEGMEDTLILKRKGGPNSWVFPLRLDGITAKAGGDNSIVLVDSAGKMLARIPRGLMQDSKVQPDGEFATSTGITYELVTVDGKQALKVTADAAWLNDPARVYPVRVDPPAQLWDDLGDAYVTQSDVRWSEDSLGVGCFDANGGPSSGCDHRRTFLSFANFTSYAYGPPGNNLAGMRITGANLHIYHTWSHDCPSTRSVHAYKVTEKWGRWSGPNGDPLMPNNAWPGAATGEKLGEVYISTNYPVCNNTGGDRNIANKWTIPITNLDLFNEWSRDPTKNYGIALTTENDDDYKGWKRFVSRDWDPGIGKHSPYIDFQWEDDVPPQIDKQYPPQGYSSPTLTPELIVQAKDPDNWPGWGLKYTFVVKQGDAVIAESPVGISESTWKIPEGKLKWGEAYWWYAEVFDGYKYAPVMSQAFSTPVPQPPVTSSLSQNGGNGFTPTTGNYTTSAVDAEVPTVGPPLTIERYYNSRDPRTDSVFGAGWSSLLDARAVNRAGQVVITYPTGENVAFGRNADGTYASPLGKYATLKPVTGGGYELVDKSGTTYTFTDVTTPGEFGITAITDAQARKLTFTYTGAKITSLTSASGRKLFIEWTADNKRVQRTKSEELVAGTPSSANVWEYTYVAEKLDKVCPPTSLTACTRYEYDVNTLHPTAVMDARPQTYLRLNEPSGTVAKSTVTSLDTATGTYHPDVTLNQLGRAGSANVAVFNGSSAVVELSAKKLPLAASYQSVSLWFKTASSGVLYSYQSMPMGAGGDQWNPALYIDTNGKLRGKFWNGGAAPLGAGSLVNARDNQWHHAVLTAAGTTQSLYLDGVLVGSMAGAITPNGTAYAFLGAGKWESWPETTTGTVFSYLNGSMSDFAWYDQPLSAEQIAQMHNTGRNSSWVLHKIKRPSGNFQATVTYETDASVKNVTDANGGVWQLAPPAITASDHTYAAAVQAQLPIDYFRMKESGVTVPFDEMNEDETDPGEYSGVTLGVDGGPFGDDIDVASFNGTSAVKLPKKNYPNGDKAHSVSLWFRTTGSGVLYGAQGHVLGELAVGGWQPALYVGVDGLLRGGYWKNGQTTTTFPVNDGAWHHAALTSNGTKHSLYLDGALVGSKQADGAAETFPVVYPHVGAGRWRDWGGSSGEYGYFNGQISEFAYFRSELSGTQVNLQVAARDSDRSAGAPGSVAAVNAAAPRDYFRLTETSGTVAVNQVGGAPTANYGNVALGDPGPFGTAASAPTFNGSYVALPSRDYPNGNTPSSVSLWFRTTVKGGVLYTAQAQPIYTIEPKSYGHQPGLYVDKDGKLRGGYWPASQIVSGREVSDGTWHHAVLTSSGTQQTLYLDGIALGTQTATPETFAQVYPYLGNGHWEGWPIVDGTHGQLFGQIGEFAYYPTQLSQAQVTAQFVARDRAKNAPVKLAMVTDPVGGETKYVHDVYSGRQIAQIDAGGGRTAFGYDKGGFLYSVTDPNGNVVLTEHDTHGNTIAETTCLDRAGTDPCSTVYTSYYTDGLKADLVETIRDARSANKDDNTYKTTYTRDAKGNVTSVTDPLTRSQNFDYTTGTTIFTDHQVDGYGRYVRVWCSAFTSTNGASIWDFEVYGGNGGKDLAARKNVTASSTWDGYFFNPAHMVDEDPVTRWASLHNNATEWVQVDLNGWYPVNRVVLAWESTHAKDYKIQISEDGTNWVDIKTITNQSSTPVPAGLVRKEASPGGAVTRRVYSTAGDVLRTVSPEGLRVEYKYDTLGRVTEKKEFTDKYPLGLTTAMTYDRLSRLETQKDPTVADRINGTVVHTKHTQVVYNDDGQIKETTTSDFQAGSTDLPRRTVIGYNNYGQKVSVTDPLDNVTTYEYDPLGRLKKQIQPDLSVITQEYTPLGRPKLIKSGTQDMESRAYDPGGRLQQITDAMGWKTVYKYTDNNLVASVTRIGPSGAQHVNQTNKYDRAGNLTEQWTNNGKTYTKYEVDAASRPRTTTVDPDGVNRTSTYTYGLDNQLLQTKLSGPSGQQLVSNTFDRNGRRLSQAVSTNPTNDLVARWKLDDAAGTTAVDSAGNRTATGNFIPSTERNGSARFDGVDDRVQTTGPVVDTSQSYSVSAWVKLEDEEKFQYILSGRGVDNERAFSLYYCKFGNGSKLWGFSSANQDAWIPNKYYDAWASATANQWVHIAGVFNAATNGMTIYVNGAPVGGAYNPSPWRGTGKVTIGAGNNGNYFKGGIDDVQVYQRALSDADVAAIHTGAGPAVDQKVQRTSWQLDKRGLPIAETDPNGNTTTYDYDESGRIAVTASSSVYSEAVGVNNGLPVFGPRMESIAYNTFGEAIESKDPNGNKMSSQRNKNGQITETWLPAYTRPDGGGAIGNVINRTEYDANGRVKKTIDPLGYETTLQYDAFGRLKKRIAPNLGETTYNYNLNGALIEVIDPNGSRTTADYDYLGREKSTSEWVGGVEKKTGYSYHDGGWLAAVTPPGRASSTFEYNNLGETTKVIDGKGNATQISYDFAGRQALVTAPDGVMQGTAYDFAGRPVEVKQFYMDTQQPPQEQVLAKNLATYDANGNVVEATDPKLNTTKFEYDATGFLTKQTQPVTDSAVDDIVTSFGYDAAGSRTRFTDGRGKITRTTYNSWGLPEKQIEPGDFTYTTVYDKAGQAVEHRMPGGVTQLSTYNNMGRLEKVTGSGAEVATTEKTFGYDAGGRLRSASGIGAIDYDERGLLTSVGGATFSYHDDGLLAQRTDAAGTTEYTYDEIGRIERVKNTQADLQLDYTYNNLSLVKDITHGGTGNKRILGYDKLRQLETDELKTPTGGLVGSIAYKWDKNGNLEKKTTAGFAGSAVNDYTYDKANRLTSWSNGTTTTNYAYDKSGNRIQAGGRDFKYNDRNQLTKSDADSVNYTYSPRGTLLAVTTGTVTKDTQADAFGQVLRQESAEGVWSDYTYDAIGRAQRTGFVYSGLTNDLAADPTASYVRGTDNEVVGTKVGAGAGVYSWTDLHTDVVGQFSATSTALTGSRTFDPYGKVVATAGMQGSLGYQSEWTDGPTGRVNMHARWYNTDTGQFDTRDPANVSPVPDSGAANKYAYAGGNPLTRVDPSGNAFMDGCKSVGACLVQGFVNAFDFVEMVTGLWNALSDIKGTINSFIGSMKEEAARWRGTIRGMMPCPWYVPNKVCDAAAEIGGWACALSGVCEIIQDCLKALTDHGSRLSCAEHVGGALADGVQGLISAGAGAVGKFLARKLLEKLRLPKKGGHDDNGNNNNNSSNQQYYDDRDEINELRKYKQSQNKNRGNKDNSTKWKPPGKPKKNNGPKPPPGAKGNGGSKNNAPPAPPKPRQPDPRPQNAAAPPSPDMPGRVDGPSNRGNNGEKDKKGCHSFNPLTPVLMADGSAKAIGDVKLGEKVAATDPATGVTTAQPVTALHVNLDRELTDVTVRAVNEGEGGRSTRGPTTTLETTQNHPFWDATSAAWVEAKDLKAGESTLTGPDGQLVEVVAVRNFVGATAMRDLTVATVHTYHVIAGDKPVLVHNNGGPSFALGHINLGVSGESCPNDPPQTDAADAATWVDEGGFQNTTPPRKSILSGWFRFQSAAPGARSNSANSRAQVPQYSAPGPNGGTITAKFDSAFGNEAIDRKLRLTEYGRDEAERQAFVAAHHGITAVYELPSQKMVDAARSLLDGWGIPGIQTRKGDW